MTKSGGKQFVSRKRTKQPNRPKGGVFKHKKSLKRIKAPQRPQQGPKSGVRAEQPVNSPLLGERTKARSVFCKPASACSPHEIKWVQHWRQSATQCLPF